MLFSFEPKTKRSELFDREEELEKLANFLPRYPFVVITGLRRVGKSSLVKVFLNENDYPSISIDCRRLYMESGGNITSSDLISYIERELMRVSWKEKIKALLKKFKINISSITVEMDSGKMDLASIFEKISAIAEKGETFFVVHFDEAQYLRFFGSRGGNDILAFLAYVYDNLPSIRVIITGSEVGVLHDFLKLGDYSSPMYGRAVYELALKPFSKNLAVEFLKQGFQEQGVKPDFDVEKVIDKIDGVPGYLVLFGMKYIDVRDTFLALEEVYRTMEALMKREIDELERRSRRYLKILKLVSLGINTWTGLKNYFYSSGDRISDSRLYELLQSLTKMTFIEKREGKYKIVDPVLEEVLRRSL